MRNKAITKLSNIMYYMYGRHAVLAALENSRRKIEKIFCTNEFFKTHQEIINKCMIDHEIVDFDFLNKILGTGQNHQGIAAKVYTIFTHDINEINFAASDCKVVVLDQITDPQNIGSIIRSAVAFGFDAIILPQDNSPMENATIAKIASGTLENIKIIKVPNLKSAIDILKKQGFWVIGFDGEATTNLNKKLLSGKIVLALGAEDKGLRRLTKENCDHIVKIPMTLKVESLNVANAASIAFYMAYSTD
jgi:23S rRNA (guanosine2251-2'-O)-methyltransferase